MSKTLQFSVPVVLLALSAWFLLSSRSPEPVIEPSPPAKPSGSSTPERGREADVASETRLGPASLTNEAVSPAAAKMTAAEPTDDVGKRLESMRELIPNWMREHGEMRGERIRLGDRWVDRLRGRYAWPEGGRVEMEVSDLGTGATREQFKSLGFDFELEEAENENEIRAIDDQKDYVANLEYSVEDGEGHVQYIVGGRFLMEVQIEGLSLDSFQEMEDRDAFISKLVQHAGQSVNGTK